MKTEGWKTYYPLFPHFELMFEGHPEVVPRPCCFPFALRTQLGRASAPNSILRWLTCHTYPRELRNRSPPQNAEDREIPARGRSTEGMGSWARVPAGPRTNVSAAEACIVWLEGVGFSQREGMSESISGSKRHSLRPATQLSFMSTGRSERLLPATDQQVRKSRIISPRDPSPSPV